MTPEEAITHLEGWQAQIVHGSNTIGEIAALVRELAADKARLDYLDRCNRAMNAAYGNLYGWKLIQSANVTRLLLHTIKDGVDLNDANAVGCYPTGLLSIRQAIDQAAVTRTGPEPDHDTAVNRKLMDWSKEWILDGDLVRCRSCKRGIIYSRRDEKFIHSADCPTLMCYPWELLIALTSKPTS